ncbi:MAG: DNA topoisomerase IV subunit A, partial [Rhodospirillales bacterium]|nr:DNA topoisomerase IV subunit A [Rhodospirillales bacterium]
GRGHGEPLRLMIDLPNDVELLTMVVHKPGRKILVAGSSGRGFAIDEAEVLAQTRAGKQILNLAEGEVAKFCLPLEGDAVAILGENRRLLVFKAEEIPEMTRGRGVILQRYKDGGVADLKVFKLAEGLSWQSSGKRKTETNLTEWMGSRASVGRMPPRGFPKEYPFFL